MVQNLLFLIDCTPARKLQVAERHGGMQMHLSPVPGSSLDLHTTTQDGHLFELLKQLWLVSPVTYYTLFSVLRDQIGSLTYICIHVAGPAAPIG
jgi:hypothetical protein